MAKSAVKLINYQLTRQELVRRMWVHYFRRQWTIISLFALGGIGAALTYFAPIPISYVGIVFLILAILAPWNVLVALSRAVKSDSTWTDPVTIEFDSDGMKSIRPKSKIESRWSRFYGFREDDKYFYLNTSKTGLGSVAIVPKRAFNSANEVEMFRQCAKDGISKTALNA